MEKKTYREVVEKAGRWLRSNKRQVLFVCLAGALMVISGVMLCALRTAPFPAERKAAAREYIPAPEHIETPEPQKSPEPAPVPEQTETPEPQKSPEPSPAPERIETPEPQKSPEPSPVPEQTETPVPQQSSEPAPESDGSGQAAEPAVHVHDWVPVSVTVHRDAVTHTVHHDAVTETVHHDPVTHEEPVYEYRTICNTCGEDITGHIQDHIGTVCQGSYSVRQMQTGVNIVTDTEAYDEEVVIENARDETVVDQEARDEEVTAGWRCSICGVMKE